MYIRKVENKEVSLNKIAVIGAGQLGSRYLQGLAQSNVDIAIEVVEPFEQSRKVAKERYEEIESNPNVSNITFFESLDSLSSDLDVVIVSTNSDVRSSIVKELLSKKSVQYIVLEKVLFQTVEEYNEVEQLLKETGTKCWVNHPRRMFPFYQTLKKEFENAGQINYMVKGGAWGMGCNSLHFLDHLSYLSGASELTIDQSALHPHVYEAKRSGFVEFNGVLNGMLGENTFSLYCAEAYVPTTINITSDTFTMFIDEANGYMRIARKSKEWKWEELNEKIVYFQSELSHVLVEQLLSTGESDLPKYEEAVKLHIPFVKALLTHMEKVEGKAFSLCPIT